MLIFLIKLLVIKKESNDKTIITAENHFENNRFPIKDKMNKSEKTSDER